ncbi:MAG: translocation/assembly module TamB domain-containing protein, partial [Melioribacteraceae bacterium]|nr:translocation/assembly module TamB domain-containing protein [Melioribacteraceae bacterium]
NEIKLNEFSNSNDTLIIQGTIQEIPPIHLFSEYKIPKIDALTASFYLDLQKDSTYIFGIGNGVDHPKVTIDSFAIQMAKNANGFTAMISADKIKQSNIIIPKLNLFLNNANALTKFNIDITNDSDYKHLIAGGSLILSDGSAKEIRLDDKIIIEETSWDILSDYPILWSQSFVEVKDIFARKGNRFLKINGLLPVNTNAEEIFIGLDFHEFPLEYVTNPIGMDFIELNGNIRGNITISGTPELPIFSTDLNILQVRSADQLFGDLSFKSQYLRDKGLVSLAARLQSDTHSVDLEGYTKSTLDSIDLNMTINHVPLELVNTFSEEYMSFEKGQLTGQLGISGNIDVPKIEGMIAAQGAIIRIVSTNSSYQLPEGTIRIKTDSIVVPSWVILDERGKKATFSGLLRHDRFSEIQSELQFSMNEFQLLKTTDEQNPIIYGNLYATGIGSIKGPITDPYITIEAETSDGSHLNFSNVAQTLDLQEDQLVLFMSPNEFQGLDSLKQKETKRYPFHLDLNLSLTDKTIFRFNIDESSGDNLLCRGVGNLTIRYDPLNLFKIFGDYVVNEGRYQYSYDQFVNKKFEIQPGSKVTFLGDPLDASLQVIALYKLQTSPYSLIKNETNLSTEELNLARRTMATE